MEYDNYDGYERYEEPTPPRRKKKKKTNVVVRFFRALGMTFAEMPAQTLILIGGSVVVVLIAVILLVVLLPKNADKQRGEEQQPQLSIENAGTPTPTLPPIITPDPALAVTPEAEPTTSGATLAKKLELWVEDPAVADVQSRLIELGYMETPDGGITTKYGPATKNAIRRFQQKNIENYKEWDGICGQATYDLLMAADAKAFYFSKGDTDEMLYDGARVTALQNRLITLGYFTAKTTGTYGNETITAVKAFQEANGLIADGIAGAATLTVLNGATAIDAATAAANKAAGITPNPIQTAAATVTDDAAASSSPAP